MNGDHDLNEIFPAEEEVEEVVPEVVEVEIHGPDTIGKVQLFEDLVAEIAHTDGKVGIYRTQRGGKKDYLCEITADLWSLGWVQANMGGGKYQFNARGGDNKYAGAVTMEIAGKSKPWPPEEEAEAEEAPELQELRRTIEEMRGGGGSMDMFKMVISMVTLMNSQSKPYIEALLAKGAERTTATELKDLMELVREMAPGGGSDDPFLTMVGPLVPPLAKILSGDQPVTANPPGAPTAPAPPAGPGSEWVNLLRPYVGQLQGWAAAGKNTLVIAQFLANTLDEGSLGIILEQLGRGEQFLIEFFLFFPEAKTFEPWYRDFWSNLAAQFDWGETPEDDVPSTPPPGPRLEPEEEELEEEAGAENVD